MKGREKFLLIATNVVTYAITMFAYTQIDITPTKGILGFLIIIPIAVTSLTIAMTAEAGGKKAKKEVHVDKNYAGYK